MKSKRKLFGLENNSGENWGNGGTKETREDARCPGGGGKFWSADGGV